MSSCHEEVDGNKGVVMLYARDDVLRNLILP